MTWSGPEGEWQILLRRLSLPMLPAVTAIGFGLVLVLYDWRAAVAGTVAGALLLAEAYEGRPRATRTVGIIVLITLSDAIVPLTPNPAAFLFFVVALAAPMARDARASVFYTLLLGSVFVITFAIKATLGLGAFSWTRLIFDIGVIAAAAATGYAMSITQRTIVQQRDRLAASLAELHASESNLQQALAAARALREAIIAIRAERTREDVLRRLCVEARMMSDADAVGFLTPDDQGTWRPSAWAMRDPHGPAINPALLPEPGTPLREALDRRGPVWLIDEQVRRSALARSIGIHAMGVMPIIALGRVEGILIVGWWRERHYPAVGERELIEVLADQAGIALESLAIRRDLAARAEGAEALHRVGSRMSGRHDPEQIVPEVLEALTSLYQADGAGYYQVNPDGSLRCLAGVGVAEPGEDQLDWRTLLDPSRITWATQETAVFADVTSDLRLESSRETLVARGIVGLILIPHILEGGAVGVLGLFHGRERTYRPHEIELLEVFAGQVAGALSLARAHAAMAIAGRQRDEFLAIVSHELRQPVTAIAMLADVVSDAPGLESAERHVLLGLRQQARSLARFAEDVLAIARLESGTFELNGIVIDLNTLVTALVDQHPDRSRLRLTVPAEAVLVLADPERLGQAIENLIGNALKYSPVHTTVSLRLTVWPGVARIDVRDEGVGLESADVTRLFQKYSRVTNERTSGIRGVGLGLYLIRLIVQAHRGQVMVSSPGRAQGSTFTICLPRAVVAEEDGRSRA